MTPPTSHPPSYGKSKSPTSYDAQWQLEVVFQPRVINQLHQLEKFVELHFDPLIPFGLSPDSCRDQLPLQIHGVSVVGRSDSGSQPMVQPPVFSSPGKLSRSQATLKCSLHSHEPDRGFFFPPHSLCRLHFLRRTSHFKATALWIAPSLSDFDTRQGRSYVKKKRKKSIAQPVSSQPRPLIIL